MFVVLFQGCYETIEVYAQQREAIDRARGLVEKFCADHSITFSFDDTARMLSTLAGGGRFVIQDSGVYVLVVERHLGKQSRRHAWTTTE